MIIKCKEENKLYQIVITLELKSYSIVNYI